MRHPADLEEEFPRIWSELSKLRRDLHRIPEIALEEYKTRDKLMTELASLPLEFHKPYLGTDIVADLIPESDWEETILLRADMDGLMIQEETGAEWESEHPGKMHACGHDGHMAILVGAARVLSSVRNKLTKRIRFVFQPGEEMRCAGRLLAEKGAYDNCDEAYALHGWPGLGEGRIRTKEGAIMAATDSFRFTFVGRGTHGATPQDGINPLPAAARFILEAEELHRRANKEHGSVVSSCIVEGGSSANIIPDRCKVEGTTRYLSREQGDFIVAELKALAQRAAASSDTTVIEQISRRYEIPVINSAAGAIKVLELATKLFGEENCEEAVQHDMMAEDFAFCLDKAPGCFFQLGLGEDYPTLHSPLFDFNDRVIKRGVLLFTALAGGFDEPLR
ncbi:MAG: M20 family metallopeptidase [Spirochaetales bacterium]|nr:M20 family metallopeptidase [Spirochaetales bacterium]